MSDEYNGYDINGRDAGEEKKWENSRNSLFPSILLEIII
jgi:hypothetical protein